jgi:hypothetical protein
MSRKKKTTLSFSRGDKLDKLFLGIHVPEWLYDDLIKYAKKYNVGYSHMCRDGLRILVGSDRPPTEEVKYRNPIPQRRKKPSP